MKIEYDQPYFRLKMLIDQKGFTQKQVANEIGINKTVFNRKINRVDGRDFTLGESRKIADLLEIQLTDFF